MQKINLCKSFIIWSLNLISHLSRILKNFLSWGIRTFVLWCLCFSWLLQMKHLYWLSCLWHCQTQIMISETEKHVFWTEFQRPPHTWFIDFISQLSSVWSLIKTKQSDWIIQGWILHFTLSLALPLNFPHPR